MSLPREHCCERGGDISLPILLAHPLGHPSRLLRTAVRRTAFRRFARPGWRAWAIDGTGNGGGGLELPARDTEALNA